MPVGFALVYTVGTPTQLRADPPFPLISGYCSLRLRRGLFVPGGSSLRVLLKSVKRNFNSACAVTVHRRPAGRALNRHSGESESEEPEWNAALLRRVPAGVLVSSTKLRNLKFN